MASSSIRATRFAELGYRQDAPRLWRFVDLNTTSSIGPQYTSRGELLGDLDRYATVFGCATAATCTPTSQAPFSADGGHSQARDRLRGWKSVEELRLYELVLRGYSSSLIANVLDRTPSSIRTRTRRLGISPHHPPCNAGESCTRCNTYHQRVSMYWDVLNEVAPDLKDALRVLVNEVCAFNSDPPRPLADALQRAERVLNRVETHLERPRHA